MRRSEPRASVYISMDPAHDSLVTPLSRRELEALEILARGEIDKDAARLLGISLGTVRVYRKRIETKLGTRGLVQSLLVAWKVGQIDLEAIADEAATRAASTRAHGREATRPIPRYAVEGSEDSVREAP